MSVQKRTDAAGRVRYRVRWRETGRQQSRTFDRKRDADAWDLEVKRRQSLGPLAVQQLTQTTPTLDDWLAERWAPEHGAHLEKRTRTRYRSSYSLHIAPHLGDHPLAELTVSRLRDWQAGRLAAGVSASEIQKCRTMLSSVLRHAAESEVIAGNPLGLVRAPKSEHRDEVRPLAPLTVERLRATIAGAMDVVVPALARKGYTAERKAKDGSVIEVVMPPSVRPETVQPDPRPDHVRLRDATIVAALAYAGLRPSELLALRWQDVGERTLLVQRATDPEGTIKGTKGRKSRSVALLGPLADDLQAWRDGNDPGPQGGEALVFPRADGRPWTVEDWGNWRSRSWSTACQRTGLDPVPRPYDARHSFASLLLAEGRVIHEVAAQLGHSAEMTLGRYGHVVAELAGRGPVDAVAEIRKARERAEREVCPPSALVPSCAPQTDDSREAGNPA